MTKEEVYSIAEDYIYYGKKSVSINDLEQQLYQLNEAHGYFLLGEIFYKGIDCEKNLNNAMGLYQKASSMNEGYASYRVAQILEKGMTGGVDIRQAAWNYMLAYIGGVKEALSDLARCCSAAAKENGYDYAKKSQDVKAEIKGDCAPDKWSNKPVVLQAPKGYCIGLSADDAFDKQEIVIDRCVRKFSYMLKNIYTEKVVTPESKCDFLIDMNAPVFESDKIQLVSDGGSVSVQNGVIYCNADLKIVVPIQDSDSGVKEGSIHVAVAKNGKTQRIDDYDFQGNARDGYTLSVNICESGYYLLDIAARDNAGNASRLTFDPNNQQYKGIVIDKEAPKIAVKDVYGQKGIINLEIAVSKDAGAMGISRITAGIGDAVKDITPQECRTSMVMRTSAAWSGTDTGRDYVCITAEDYAGNKTQIFHDPKPVKDIHSKFDFIKQTAPKVYDIVHRAECMLRRDYNIGEMIQAAFDEIVDDLCRQNDIYVSSVIRSSRERQKKLVDKLNKLSAVKGLDYLNEEMSYEAATGRRCRGSKVFFLSEISSQAEDEKSDVPASPRRPMPGYQTSFLALEVLYDIAVKVYGGSAGDKYSAECIPLKEDFYVEKSYVPQYVKEPLCNKELVVYKVSEKGHKDYYIARAYVKAEVDKDKAEADNNRLNDTITAANDKMQLVFDSELAQYESESSEIYYLINRWQ